MKTEHPKKKVLDYGYVQLVDVLGSDERIIEAARMSTGKGFQGWGPKCKACGSDHFVVHHENSAGQGVSMYCDGDEGYAQVRRETDKQPECVKCKGTETVPGDEKLLRYLWENKHATPFEMGAMTIEVQAPIFVIREWHRHRTQSYNEMSARYVPMPDVNYIPTVERLMMNSKTNKQAGTAQDAAVLTEHTAELFRIDMDKNYRQFESDYQLALRRGVPKELARIVMPVGRYSRMRASANIRNWLGFLTLRMDKAAQWEIREYAKAVHKILKAEFPRTLTLFDEGMKR